MNASISKSFNIEQYQTINMKIEYLIERSFPTYSKQDKRTDADNVKAGKEFAKKAIMKVFLSDLQAEILKLIAIPVCKYARAQGNGGKEIGVLAFNSKEYYYSKDEELDKSKDKIAEELKNAGFELICENHKLILMVPLVTYAKTIYIAGGASKIMALRYDIITKCMPVLDEVKDKLDYYGISGFDIRLYFKFATHIENGKEYNAKEVCLLYINNKDMQIEGNLEYINRYATAWEIFTQLLVHPYKISVPFVNLIGSFKNANDVSGIVQLTKYVEFDSIEIELGSSSHITTLKPLIDAMGPNKKIKLMLDNEGPINQHTLTDELALELTGMTHKELLDREIKAKRTRYDKHKISIIQFNTSITPDDLSSLEIYCF